MVQEDEKRADWGGRYSIYRIDSSTDLETPKDADRARFLSAAAKIGAIELELAATAAFLYEEDGIGRLVDGDPWEETARLKPDKASHGRLKRARKAYQELREMHAPTSLPPIV